MATYTVPDLAKRGARYALQLLLQHVHEGGEPFVTYGAIAQLLETKLRIPKVFPTHIGWVAGEMMDRIEAVDPDAPLINGLVTRPTGVPGRGFGGYYNRLLRPAGGREWDNLGNRRKLAVVEEVRRDVRNFDGGMASIGRSTAPIRLACRDRRNSLRRTASPLRHRDHAVPAKAPSIGGSRNGLRKIRRRWGWRER